MSKQLEEARAENQGLKVEIQGLKRSEGNSKTEAASLRKASEIIKKERDEARAEATKNSMSSKYKLGGLPRLRVSLRRKKINWRKLWKI